MSLLCAYSSQKSRCGGHSLPLDPTPYASLAWREQPSTIPLRIYRHLLEYRERGEKCLQTLKSACECSRRLRQEAAVLVLYPLVMEETLLGPLRVVEPGARCWMRKRRGRIGAGPALHSAHWSTTPVDCTRYEVMIIRDIFHDEMEDAHRRPSVILLRRGSGPKLVRHLTERGTWIARHLTLEITSSDDHTLLISSILYVFVNVQYLNTDCAPYSPYPNYFVGPSRTGTSEVPDHVTRIWSDSEANENKNKNKTLPRWHLFYLIYPHPYSKPRSSYGVGSC